MSSVAVNSSSLPVARRELRSVAHSLRGERCWTIKDPITLRYFQFREEEYFILQLLNGEHTLDEIIQRFEEHFAPKKLRRGELSGFVMMLHREGLTVASAYGQGEHLLARRGERSRAQWLSGLLNVLAIKLPGINPDQWLTGVMPALRWLYSPLALVMCILLGATAAALLVTDTEGLLQRLPKFRELVGPGNFLSMVLALALVKTLHELGHAFTCKYFGGECNRLGLMFLLFTPALYCDVSDAWMFPKKWQRIAVSAAGMVVELVLASLATVLWSLTQPGWFNTLLFNIMLVCSVGTLLINGNPLLRYDGYFIFADWIGIPNLREQSSAALRRHGAWWFAGVELDEPRLLADSRPGLLLVYGLLSLAYRWLMIGGILWLLYAACAPYGLTVLAQVMTVIVLASQAIGPAMKVGRFVSDPTKCEKLSFGRVAGSGCVVALLLVALLAIPCPRRVTAPLQLQPADARQVFVTTPGVLEQALEPGAKVVTDQTIATLRNRALELEIAELSARAEQQRLQLRQLQIRRHTDVALGDGLPVAERTLADLEAQLSQKHRQRRELVVKSPLAGTLFPPRSQLAKTQSGELRELVGTPLDSINRGCYLETGALLCTVGSPERLEALVIIHESEVPLVSVDQQVRLAIDSAPGMVLTGTVAAISAVNARDLPAELQASGAFAMERTANGRQRPQGSYYQAIVELATSAAPLRSGGLGYAKILVDPEPLGLRLYRNLRGTFRWPQ